MTAYNIYIQYGDSLEFKQQVEAENPVVILQNRNLYSNQPGAALVVVRADIDTSEWGKTRMLLTEPLLEVEDYKVRRGKEANAAKVSHEGRIREDIDVARLSLEDVDGAA